MGTAPSKEKESEQSTIEGQNLKDILREQVWAQYPMGQMFGAAPDQTTLFFNSLPDETRESFLRSSKRIVQFGVASGRYLSQEFPEPRERVGYDYTNSSATMCPFTHRLVDLEQTEGEELAYQANLEEDLSEPCDILLIRILEYLNAEAATLLLAQLIKTAKPGSVFYIDLNKPAEETPLTNGWVMGRVAQFFEPAESFETNLHKVVAEQGDESKFGQTEQLVVTKR